MTGPRGARPVLPVRATGNFRMKPILLFSLLIVLGSANWCRADGDTEKAANQGANVGGISGRVIDANQVPLRKAKVWLHSRSEKVRGEMPAFTTLEVDASGNFCFANLSPGAYIVFATAEGVAMSGLDVNLQVGHEQKCEIVLRPGVQSIVKFRNDSGAPISGVTLAGLRCRTDSGEFSINRDSLTALGMPPALSDQEGRLLLPPLPEGAVISAAVFDHADFATAIVKDLRIAPGEIAAATMHGMKLTLRFAPAADGRKISSATLEMAPFQTGSVARRNQKIAIGADGAATLTVEPGNYDVMRLQNDDYIITPQYSNDLGGLEIGPGRNDTLSFEMHPKVKTRGRVTDGVTGKPVKDAGVFAIIPNHPVSDWTWTLGKSTDADGQYELDVPPGAVRIAAHYRNLTMGKPYLEAQIDANGKTTLPDIELWPTPKIGGRVIDPMGKPVAGAIVRLGGSYFGSRDPVVATGENGEFQFQVPRIPDDSDFGGLAWSQPLEAFHPYQPLSASMQLQLDQPESAANLVIKLQPESFEAFLTRVKEPTSRWAKLRESVLKTKKEIARQESVPGQPAPELEGAFWLNTERPTMSLADFRGKYVLLVFGGYDADVKLLHATYKDRGLAVVGIQDYSANAEAARARPNQNGLTFPLMIDERDRRTIAAYERIGAVRGYPNYVLVGPDGKIVETRAITNYKFEYIRNYLFGDGQK
jgi:peroxiredoxin